MNKELQWLKRIAKRHDADIDAIIDQAYLLGKVNQMEKGINTGVKFYLDNGGAYEDLPKETRERLEETK